MYTKTDEDGQIRLELLTRRELPFWRTFTEVTIYFAVGSSILLITFWFLSPVGMVLGIAGSLLWGCGYIGMKSLTEPFKKTFVIDVKAKTLTYMGTRSKPLSSWRYSWRFDEIEKLCFTEERKGVPNGLQLRIKERKKPIDIEFLRCHGGSKKESNRSKSGNMVTLYKEFVSLVPGISSVSERMLQVYESSLAQWDKGDVRLSDIEVPDLQEEGEISNTPRK